MDEGQERALWRRWRQAQAQNRGAEIDPMALAAYAEGRLLEEDADAVEARLALEPALIEDILFARNATPTLAPAALVARLKALPPAPPRRHWQGTTPWWGALAASVMVASFVGFSLGHDAYLSFAGPTQPGVEAVDQADFPLFTLAEDSGR
ncbi:MAG TPA: hypothetical protein VKT70_00060 [Stellaceae bacterium]|nr:hypothetical protein [Stellaceae bacterium]